VGTEGGSGIHTLLQADKVKMAVPVHYITVLGCALSVVLSQSGLTFRVLGIELRLPKEEQLDDLQMPIGRSAHEGRPADVGLGFEVGPPLDEELDDGELAVLGGEDEGGEPVWGGEGEVRER
jgi:hypothetical protein